MGVKISDPVVEFEAMPDKTIEELREEAKLRNMDEKTRTLYLAQKNKDKE